MCETGKFAGFVAAIDHQYVVLNDERAVFFKNVQSSAVIIYDETNDAVIDGIAGCDRVDIDFRFRQGVCKPGEHAGTVIEKNRELFGDLHN